MSELWGIILTAVLTIAGGIVIYVVGHLFEAIFVEPIHRLRSLIGEIADSLVFYANVYSNPGILPTEKCDEASETLRQKAAQLKSRAYCIPWYSLWSLMGLVRKKTEIEEAAKELIGLSNSVRGSSGANGRLSADMRRRIEESLGILDGGHRGKQSTSSYALSQGILLFFFALILLGLQTGEFVFFGHIIPAFPIWWYKGLGIIALIISILLLIVAIFCNRASARIERFLEKRPMPRWQATIQYIYWVIFWLVYFAGWSKSLSNIPAGGLTFHVAFWVGLIWFFAIPIFVGYKLYLHRKK